jgi:hypothetical protein
VPQTRPRAKRVAAVMASSGRGKIVRDRERAALETVYSALEKLDEPERERVLAWIIDRFRYAPANASAATGPERLVQARSVGEGGIANATKPKG